MVKINFNKKFLLYILYFAIFSVGVFLRTKYFCINNVLAEDECRLALSLLETKNVFLPLFAAQSAPPMFSLVTKVFINILGTHDYVYKIVPFISSILSLIMFYYLSCQLFKKKLCVVLSFLIFSLSVPLILFSSVFKQYSSDVLIGIICLYYLPKINIDSLRFKNLLMLTLALVILPFISLTSVFFIVAFFILKFNRKLVYPFVIFCVVMFFYYYFNLQISNMNMHQLFPHYWDEGFIDFSLKAFFKIIAIHLKFLFVPNKLILFQMILLIISIGYAVKDKNFHLLLVSLFLILAASLFHVYPFFGRVALYTVSIFILLMVKALDSNLKIFNYFVYILFFLSFYNYFFILSSLNEYCIINESPEKLMSVLKDKYNNNNDLILCNIASEASYVYYARRFNFREGKIIEIPPKDNLNGYFKQLNKNKIYWLYLIKDYKKETIFPIILDWVNNQDILEFYKDRKSYLIKIKILKN